VENLGERLAAQAPGPQFPYRFKVVNASDINAFALPGGFVYVNRGVLESARDEGEVAGVIAHEIAHVALRHGTHNASKAYLTQAGVGILGGILGGHVGAGTAQVLNAVGGLGMNALFLRYSREAESDADVLGAQIMARAGYDPEEMVSFFNTLTRSDRSRTIRWLSDHPAPQDRSRRIRREAAMLNVRSRAHSESAFRNVQASLRSMGPARTMQQIGAGYRSR
jgi:predicted Zn-dependent protease